MKALELNNFSRQFRLLAAATITVVLSFMLIFALDTPENLSLLVIVFFLMLSIVYFIEPAHFTICLIIFFMVRGNILSTVIKNSYRGQNIANIDAVCWAFLFFLIFCGKLIRGKRFHFGPKDLLISMSLVILLGIFSGLLHHVPPVVLLHGIYGTFKGFVIYLIFANMYISNYERYCQKFTYGVFFVSFIILIGIVPNLIYHKEMASIVGFNLDTERDMRWLLPSVHSIFSHPHRFCYFMGYILFLFFALFLTKRRIKFLLGMIVSFLNIFLSMRRAELVASVISLWSVLLIRVEQISLKKRLLLPILVIILIIPAIGYVKTQFEMGVEKITTKNINSVARLALYWGSFELANKSFPLGAGLGRFASVTSARYYSPVYKELGMDRISGLEPNSEQLGRSFITDTFYPHIIGETGWIGLFCYLLFLLFTITNIKRIFLIIPQKYPYLKGYALALFCYFIYISITALVASVFYEPVTQILAFGGMGILVNYYQSSITATSSNAAGI